MSNVNDKYLIIKFLKQSLTKEEALLFASRKEDSEFIKKLENEIITIKNRSLLKERLKTISNQNTVNKKKQKSKYLFIGIAASITLFIVLNIFNQSPNNHTLYDTFYTTYPNIYIKKGVENSSLSVFEKAMSYYDSKDYIAAKKVFEDISTKRALNENESFYHAMTLMELNKHESAEKELRSINDIASPFYTEAKWYLALNLIKRNKKDEAIKTLESILKSKLSGTKRKNNTTELLKKIK